VLVETANRSQEVARAAMKVADVTQFWSPSSGGVRRYVSEKVRFLRACGGRHVLIIPGERDTVSGEEDARVYTIASPRVSKTTGYRVLLRLSKIERILAEERPDIVESGDPYQVGWRVARAAGRLGIPAVAFYHSHFAESEVRPIGNKLGRRVGNWLVRMTGRYCARLYNRFAKTLVPSPPLAAILAEWGVNNATAVDLGVDTELYRPSPEAKSPTRAELGLPAGRRVLLSVGRLAAEKNTKTLCAAFALLARQHPGTYHLLITGEGTQRKAVEKVRAQTGAVTWLPFISGHAELLRLYHAADLFVHPGVQETFGLVTLEAQACGLPLVGIRGTPMDRIVCHDQSFWAAENSAEALAEAIHSAFSHNLGKLGTQARAAVEEHFAWGSVLERQFDLYREVIHNFQHS
jgi:alpha-1,6-mannosyltransferase